MQTTAADEIRTFAAREYVEAARRRGLSRVQIRVGDVHKALKLKSRVPNVCSALRSRIFLEKNHLKIVEESGPPSGMGTRTTFTYRLLDDKEPQGALVEVARFEKLRGLLKDALGSLGGGENFLRREREHFYASNVPEEK